MDGVTSPSRAHSSLNAPGRNQGEERAKQNKARALLRRAAAAAASHRSEATSVPAKEGHGPGSAANPASFSTQTSRTKQAEIAMMAKTNTTATTTSRAQQLERALQNKARALARKRQRGAESAAINPPRPKKQSVGEGEEVRRAVVAVAVAEPQQQQQVVVVAAVVGSVPSRDLTARELAKQHNLLRKGGRTKRRGGRSAGGGGGDGGPAVARAPAPHHPHQHQHQHQPNAFKFCIVLDFESTCFEKGEQERHTQEIIEFPAVLLDFRTGT